MTHVPHRSKMLTFSILCYAIGTFQCLLFTFVFLLFVKGLGKYGVLFYNALIIVIPTVLASAFTGDLHKVNCDQVHYRYLLLFFGFLCQKLYSVTTLYVLIHRQSHLKTG